MREAFRKEGLPYFFAELRNPFRRLFTFMKFCQSVPLGKDTAWLFAGKGHSASFKNKSCIKSK